MTAGPCPVRIGILPESTGLGLQRGGMASPSMQSLLRVCKREAVHGMNLQRKLWRRGWDSNPRMEVLQTSPLGLLGTAPERVSVYRKPHHGVSASSHGQERKTSRSYVDMRFAQESRRLFRRRRTDIKSRAPLEPRHFGELGHDLDVPV